MSKGRSILEIGRLVQGQRDWRKGLWNQWLVSYLTPKDEDLEEISGPPWLKQETSVPLEKESEADAQAETKDAKEGVAAALPAEEPSPVSEPIVERRPAESARARLDSITDHLLQLESQLERLGERISLHSSADRRRLQSLSENLDRVILVQEQQSEALIGLARALERIERKLAKSSSFRLSSPPIYGAELDEAPNSFFSVHEGASAERRETMRPLGRDRSEAPPDSEVASTLSGSLSELSVPTLLGMIELEKRTGRLLIERGPETFGFALYQGKVVEAHQGQRRREALEVLRQIIGERDGRFVFSSMPIERGDGALSSVGALLLSASHRNDEGDREARSA